jgi:hypothetical protein
MAHALFARDDAPIEPQAFGRIPFEHIAPAQNLQPGLIDRLALFKGHRGRHVIDALADEACGFQDDLRSLGGGRLAPDCKSPFGGRERIVEIGGCRGRDGPEDAFIGWIDHRLAAGALPAAIDIEFDLGVICHGDDLYRWVGAARTGCSGSSIWLDHHVLISQRINRYIQLNIRI